MSKQNPVESFNIREAKGNDFYRIMVVNEALKGFKNKNLFPWLLFITIDMENTTGDYNLPTENEAEVLNAFEDDLTSLITNTVSYQFIGRITDDGKRELYYYVESPQEIHSRLNHIIETNNYKREFQYEILEDTNWAKVDFFFDY